MTRSSEIDCGICGTKIRKVYRSPFFCWRCDKARIERISRTLGIAEQGTRSTTVRQGYTDTEEEK